MSIWWVRRRRLFALTLVVLVVGVAEVGARFAFPHIFRRPDKSLQLLRGEDPLAARMVLGQSYLNYVPAPGFKTPEGEQHNAHGYRGTLVPVIRRPATLRILCLGGSTTYGWKVLKPEHAYPAQLRRELGLSFPGQVKEVEVINAGLPWGTSAELLTHYHFKFHYYRPDWVVIHTGLNDAQALDSAQFQPDYSHWRKHLEQVWPLPRGLRWLSHSRLLSLALIPLLVGMAPDKATFNRDPGDGPEIAWFPPGPPGKPKVDAFVHNVRALLEMIKRDGAKVALMPERWSPQVMDNPERQEQLRLSTGNSVRLTRTLNGRLKEIAGQEGALFIPFPPGIAAGSWEDEAHVNTAGCHIKAKHVAAHLRAAIQAE